MSKTHLRICALFRSLSLPPSSIPSLHFPLSFIPSLLFPISSIPSLRALSHPPPHPTHSLLFSSHTQPYLESLSLMRATVLMGAACTETSPICNREWRGREVREKQKIDEQKEE